MRSCAARKAVRHPDVRSERSARAARFSRSDAAECREIRWHAAQDFTTDELAAGEALFARPGSSSRACRPQVLPSADRPEMAFAGRSNVGKSSLINALVGQHGLARTSNTPGRTQELNYFETPGAALFLVDMPGYGFAKAPKDKVDAWTELVQGLSARATHAGARIPADRCPARPQSRRTSP